MYMKNFISFRNLFLLLLLTVGSVNGWSATVSYIPVSVAPTDWSGVYLMTSTGKILVGSSGTSTNYGSIADLPSPITQQDVEKYELTITASANGYSMYLKDVGYLGWSSSNSLRFDTSITEKQNEWILSMEEGVLTITSCKDNARKLQYNAASPRFACYGNTGQTPVTLYKKEIVDVASPEFTLLSGNYYTPQSIEIECISSDAVLYYTVDGSDPTTNSSIYNGAITINTTTTLKAVAVSDTSYSPIVSALYIFPSLVEVDNVAAFLASNTTTNTNTVYKITGEVSVMYQNGNSLYVEDATGGLLIYGTIGNEYSNGTRLTGICGTFQLYNNYGQLVPLYMPLGEDRGTVLPTVMDVTEITRSDAYRYIKISDVSFTENVTYGITSTVNGTIVCGTGTITVRNNFKNFSMTCDTANKYSIVGIVVPYNKTVQFYPIAIELYSALEDLDTPIATTATIINSDLFKANWNAVPNAQSYELTVRMVGDGTAISPYSVEEYLSEYANLSEAA